MANALDVKWEKEFDMPSDLDYNSVEAVLRYDYKLLVVSLLHFRILYHYCISVSESAQY